jgi:putative flippase GtrA
MSRLKHEAGILSRYSLSGALNTVAGFSTIFGLTALGFQPYAANAAGYLVGLVLGFFVSRRFVFRHEGKMSAQGARYLMAFGACFAINLLVLRFALQAGIHEMWAQAGSTAVYIVAMFLALRLFVFHHRAN